MPTSPLVSLGYEGRGIDELVSQLVGESVTVLVDVRLTPLSRKPGFSKRRLAEALSAAGIDYVHLRALGNPKENRDPFRAGDPRSHRLYEDLLDEGAGAEALRHVGELLDGETVALLCFERDHRQCHRHLVAEALRRSKPTLELVEI
jgi:uncharacterized protein (DUF488 family)